MSALPMERQENYFDTVTIRGIEYKKDYEGNLFRYNKKHKMWVKLKFSDISELNSIMNVLRENYITAATKAQLTV